MRNLIVIILILIGYSSQAQNYQPYPAKWRFTNSQRFDSTVRFYNLPTSTRTNGDTVLTWNPFTKKIEKKIKLTLGNPADAVTNPEMLRVNGGAYFDGEHGVTINSPLQVNYGTTINNLLTVNDGGGIVVNNGGDVRATGVLSTAHTSGIGQVEFGQNASVLAPKNTTNRTWYLPDSSGTLALTSMIPTNYWSTSGNAFSNGNYLGTSNNRGFGVRTNGKQSIYIDSMPRGARVGIAQKPLSNDTSRLQVKGGVLIDTMLSIYNSSGTTYSGKIITSGNAAHTFTTSSISRTTGERVTVKLSDAWNPSSGSSDFYSLMINPFIYPTGSASGIQRGVYIVPTGMSSGTKYRSIDIGTSNSGSSWGIYQNTALLRNWLGGKVGIGSGKSSPVYGLDINSRVAINTDSLPTGLNTDSVVMIRSTGQLTKRPFSAFGGGSSYTAGRGLTLNSSVFRLDTTLSLTWTNAKTVFNSAATSSANHGVFNVGSGGFSGGANNFTGSANGTLIAGNAASGYTGDLMNLQVAGVKQFGVTNSGAAYFNGTVQFGTSGFGNTAASSTGFNNGYISWHTSGYFINFTNNFGYEFLGYGGSNASSGNYYGFAVRNQTIAQSGTAGYTDFLVNRAAQSSVGSGNQFLADFQVAGVSKTSISNDGNVAAKSVRGVAVTFANVPTPVEGMMLGITDSTTDTWGATITGGGSLHVLAYYNGTNWTVFAK